MSNDDQNGESFDETLRSIAEELGRFIERSIEDANLDELVDSVGVDPSVARSWMESAGSWLRANTEHLGDELARRMTERRVQPTADVLREPTAHPLDLPSDEQGRALAALDSGRWAIEPGTDALAARGEGPAPHGALGIVRELRVRDWITADGELTLAGRQALSRWLEHASSR